MKPSDWKKVTEEVFYARKRLVTISQDGVDSLKKQALCNKRRRSRLCAHNNTQDITQEMVIALGWNNYVHPHKHLGKSESFHIIEGSADLIFFDEEGQVTDVIELGDISTGKVFYYRIAAPLYHSVLVTSEMFVFHETTKGPYVASNRRDTVFAPWAPSESAEESVRVYMNDLVTETRNIKESLSQAAR